MVHLTLHKDEFDVLHYFGLILPIHKKTSKEKDGQITIKLSLWYLEYLFPSVSGFEWRRQSDFRLTTHAVVVTTP